MFVNPLPSRQSPITQGASFLYVRVPTSKRTVQIHIDAKTSIIIIIMSTDQLELH